MPARTVGDSSALHLVFGVGYLRADVHSACKVACWIHQFRNVNARSAFGDPLATASPPLAPQQTTESSHETWRLGSWCCWVVKIRPFHPYSMPTSLLISTCCI